MNDNLSSASAFLAPLRAAAESMGITSGGWQWIGPHMSQRMFDITEERAKAYAARHGGKAEPMPSAAEMQARLNAGFRRDLDAAGR
jgi:hypothetical protein